MARRNVAEPIKETGFHVNVDIVRENGDTMPICADWNGYFERLSYIEVVSLVINSNKRYTL